MLEFLKNNPKNNSDEEIKEDEDSTENPKNSNNKENQKGKMTPINCPSNYSSEKELETEKVNTFEEIREQIEEVKEITLNNERLISELIKDSANAMSLANKAKPEKNEEDYKKIDIKVNSISEELKDTKKILNVLIEELRNIKENEIPEKTDSKNILKQDFEEFSKKIKDEIDKNDKKLSAMVETSLQISKTNKEDLKKITCNIKQGKMVDNEDEMGQVVGLIDSLAEKVSEIEKKIKQNTENKISGSNKNKIKIKIK